VRTEIVKRDWLGILLIVIEIVIILIAAALVYAAFHSY
jgi:hypothetical protein